MVKFLFVILVAVGFNFEAIACSQMLGVSNFEEVK